MAADLWGIYSEQIFGRFMSSFPNLFGKSRLESENINGQSWAKVFRTLNSTVGESFPNHSFLSHSFITRIIFLTVIIHPFFYYILASVQQPLKSFCSLSLTPEKGPKNDVSLREVAKKTWWKRMKKNRLLIPVLINYLRENLTSGNTESKQRAGARGWKCFRIGVFIRFNVGTTEPGRWKENKRRVIYGVYTKAVFYSYTSYIQLRCGRFIIKTSQGVAQGKQWNLIKQVVQENRRAKFFRQDFVSNRWLFFDETTFKIYSLLQLDA